MENEIDMTNLERYKASFKAALKSEHSDDPEIQAEIDSFVERRLANIIWEEEAKIELSLWYNLNVLTGLYNGWKSLDKRIDYTEIKDNFEQRIRRDLDVCICSPSVKQQIVNLLTFSQEHEWTDEIIEQILETGHEIISSYTIQHDVFEKL
jgi:hypothetical protein